MVSKASSKVKSDAIVKTEDVDADAKPSPGTPMTGRQLLSKYLNNYMDSDISYKKVCNALEMLERMDPAGRSQFIDQLADTSDLLDARCSALVNNIAHVPWRCIPKDDVDKFHKLLREIAVRHVCHTETIYQAAVNNLIPSQATDLDEYIDKQTEQIIFSLAHTMIADILNCFPMSSKSLMSLLRRNFPHFSRPANVFTGYIRNLIQIGEYAPYLYFDIWDLIIDNAVVADSVLTRKEGRSDDILIFQMDHRNIKSEGDNVDDSDEHKKLNSLNADIFSYLSMKHHIPPHSALENIRINNHVTGSDIFLCFLSILENRLIMSVNVRYTSFIWLYLCSLNDNYIEKLLDFLWTIAIRPQHSQSDTKKAHGAMNYLAAFLARAKAVTIREAVKWMKRIFDWCVNYLDTISSIQAYAGGIRNGLFYAQCQAFFIVFSFRYKDMVKTGDIEDIRRWGIGRIVHSSLEPLRYVSRPVGLCFGAISRSLQLVYVNHVLRENYNENKPFEAAFPLDFYNLSLTVDLISPLVRRFSPLAEDLNVLTSVLKSDVVKLEDDDAGMDFLDEEDLTTIIVDKSIPINQQNSIFTDYSSSPGLCSFETSMR